MLVKVRSVLILNDFMDCFLKSLILKKVNVWQKMLCMYVEFCLDLICI